MCNAKSIAMFINESCSHATIRAMHETMIRLYQAAKELQGLEAPTDVANALNQSPQTIKNWEYRGMSQGGMLIAQEVIGCSASWLKNGGPMETTGTSAAVSLDYIAPKSLAGQSDSGNIIVLSADENRLISLFSGLTTDQQKEVIRQLQDMKRRNDAILEELSKRNKGRR